MMTVFYNLGDKLYVNITNMCSCECVFCIRKNASGVGNAESLWLEREPDLDELKKAFDGCSLDKVSEIVFCGYGEPMERADDVIGACEYIKSKTDIPLRLNTNGLVELINPSFDLSRLRIFDSVSVSLNADNADEYLKVSRPRFGVKSFEAVLNFAKAVKEYTNVNFTVVDFSEFTEISLEKCRAIAESIGVPLRVRHCVTDNADY